MNLDVKLHQTEAILDYFLVKSVDNLEAHLPAVKRVPEMNFLHHVITALAGWAVAPVSSKSANSSCLYEDMGSHQPSTIWPYNCTSQI